MKSRRSEIYTASEQKQACWKFAKGECKRGDRCKFSHGNSNSKSFGPSSGHEKQNGSNGQNLHQTRLVEIQSGNTAATKEKIPPKKHALEILAEKQNRYSCLPYTCRAEHSLVTLFFSLSGNLPRKST